MRQKAIPGATFCRFIIVRTQSILLKIFMAPCRLCLGIGTEDIRSNEVDMSSTDEPTCGAVGCFTGLISIVADDIPELKEIYLFSSYNCYNWKDTLYDFLECDFSKPR
jgi:hypothetical protein